MQFIKKQIQLMGTHNATSNLHYTTSIWHKKWKENSTATSSIQRFFKYTVKKRNSLIFTEFKYKQWKTQVRDY